MVHRQKDSWIFRPHLISLSFVGRRFRFATHIVKACFGMCPLNQIVWAHCLIVERGLSMSQVLPDEKPWQSVPFTIHILESGSAEAWGGMTVVRWIWRARALSDLGCGSVQFTPSEALYTVAVSGILKLQGPVGPMCSSSRPKGVQQSYQKIALSPFPTRHFRNCCAIGLSDSHTFQVQVSVGLGCAAQKLTPWRWWDLCHWDQREPLFSISSHI